LSTTTHTQLIAAARELSDQIGRLKFAPPVAHIYNPLTYARAPHEEYLRRFGGGPKRVIFLGMNPGPFGMVQTGIPFGEVPSVRDWLGIQTPVGQPADFHPKRPVTGFACTRSEVSGRRLWGLFAKRFGPPEQFFREHYVVNYCPLAFCDEGGRNLTPDKLAPAERARVEAVCDRHLRRVVEILEPEWLVGIGAFARERAEIAVIGTAVKVGQVLHPSPASPKANRHDWGETATGELIALGIWR